LAGREKGFYQDMIVSSFNRKDILSEDGQQHKTHDVKGERAAAEDVILLVTGRLLFDCTQG
jgi:hypothetical protein